MQLPVFTKDTSIGPLRTLAIIDKDPLPDDLKPYAAPRHGLNPG